jgi:hypothetical protein
MFKITCDNANFEAKSDKFNIFGICRHISGNYTQKWITRKYNYY